MSKTLSSPKLRESDLSMTPTALDIDGLTVPIAIFQDTNFDRANAAFYELVPQDSSSLELFATHQKLQRILSEIAIVRAPRNFEILVAQQFLHCWAIPYVNDPSLTAVFIEDRSLEVETEKSNALLYRLSLLLAASDHTSQEKLQATVDQILFELDVFDCCIFLFNRLDGLLHPTAWGSTDILSPMNGLSRFKPGEGVAGYVYQTHRPIVIPNVLEDSRFLRKPNDSAPVALACVPMVLNGNVLGVICISREPGRTFTDREIQLFSSIASRLGGLIEADTIRQEEEFQAQFARLMNNFHGSTDSYRPISQIVIDLLKVDRSLLFICDSDAEELELAYSGGSKRPTAGEVRQIREFMAQESIAQQLKQNDWLRVTDEPLLGGGSAIIFPLRVRRECLGYLIIQNMAWPRPFTDHELSVGTSIVAQLSVAIENHHFNEEVLNERNKLDQIQNTLHDGLILYTPEMEVAMYNQAAKRLLGIKRDIAGKPWETVLNKKMNHYCSHQLNRHFDPVEFLTQAKEHGKISTGLATIESNPHKIVEITVAPVYNRRKQISGILSHFRDITQVYELQQKMTNRVQQLTGLFKISSVTGFNVQQIVRRILRLLLSLLNVKVCRLILSDEADGHLYTVESSGETALLDRHEAKLLRKAQWVVEHNQPAVIKLGLPNKLNATQGLMVPVLGHHETCIGVLLVAGHENDHYFSREDINLISIVASRIASKLDTAWLLSQMEQDRNKLAALIEQSVDGILVVNLQEEIEIWNDALERLTGIDNREMIGQKASHARHLIEILEQNAHDDVTEVKIKHRHTGQLIWLGIAYAPIINSNETTGYIAIVRDITRQKELERAKNEFISTASHELRSPITAIVGYLSMLKRGDAGRIINNQQAFFVDKAYQNAKRMVGLVEDLLMTTRMETGQVRYQAEKINLTEIIEGIVSDLRFRAEEKSITLTLDHSRTQAVWADRDGVHQVMSNIITNAIKYTPTGGKVTIEFSRQEQEGQPVIVTAIKDTGVGIDASDQAKIFEKFTRIDNPLSVHAGGTGLGLYITKTIVEELGGRIWLESIKDKGSIFYISLPAVTSRHKERNI